MYVATELVFTELHKTGSTHIGSCLARLVDGKQVGKHNRIPVELWNRFIIGSIRNPWDWYVSLWAYGCAGKGSVYQQVTRRIDIKYLMRQLHAEMGAKRTSPLRVFWQLCHNITKPTHRWRETYRDYSDAKAFRSWLSLILDSRRRFDLGEGYGFSPVSKHSGLLTYRFLKLFSRLGTRLYNDRSLADLKKIPAIWKETQLISYVIRVETLEKDLLAALSKAGVKLTSAQKDEVIGARKKKTNKSKRFPTSYYYDEEAIELVTVKEQFIIQNFSYTPPV